ncbi:MAG: carboxylesterase family protein [Lachnospiraceae bacterium]|nr:carboxylesterase family protein [Lachnospiraceae bacterium]
MAFTIIVVIITILYLAILELSKNLIIGWVIGVILAAGFIVLRFYLKSKQKNTKKVLALCWLGFFALLVVNTLVTGPPEKQVPAVDNKNPDVTSVVHVNEGDLTGVYNEDHSVKVYAGVPYAAPPVGENRFKEPQPAESWSGVKACDYFAPMAMQSRGNTLYDSLSHILGWHDYQMKLGDEYIEAMSEDCLYLNVFVPEGYSGESLPVLFYIHGGSLNSGHSSYTEYRGEDLAKQGIIVVSIAYRVGVFGYYAADDLKAESPNGTTGNYGLLDQIAALKWVRENVSSFGGDPNRITIAGESAGSSSVNALCVSPLSEGMFNYAIAESSSILPYKPFHTFRDYATALEKGNTVRSEFNASSSADLRSVPADKLVTTKSEQNAMTLDGYAITEMPYVTYERGANHEKALLNGFNAKEADAFLLGYEATSQNYEELLKRAIEPYEKEMAQVVPANTPQRDQHFIIDPLGDAKGALCVAYSAMWFTYSHYVWNNYLVEQGIPAYEYYFTKTNNILSNYHAGELPYAYGNLWRHPGLYSDEDYKLSDTMQKYFVNFVKTGNPNGEGLPNWEMRDKDHTQLLQLDTEIKMVDDPNLHIYPVIDKYQQANKPQ